MRIRHAKIAVVVLLSFTLGLHWAVLQSIAWVGMTLDYSRTEPLSSALSKTFDGQNPCNLCKLVRDGQEKERQQPNAKNLLKKDLLCLDTPAVVVFACELAPLPHSPRFLLTTRALAPSLPPPRQA